MRFKDLYYNLEKLDEATINSLRKGTSKLRKIKSLPVKSKLDSVARDGAVTFKSNSITTKPNGEWTQIVKPTKKIPKDVSLNDLRDYYNGDVKVYCNCPDFKYRFGYKATEEDYKLGNKETIPSNETNPPKDDFPQGAICKHTFNTLNVLKANLPSILKQFREKNGVKNEF